MTGAETAIQIASQRGWEAVVLVMVMIGLITLTGFIVRWLIHSMDRRMEESIVRERDLGIRIRTLEDFVESTLIAMVENVAKTLSSNIEAVRALTESLNKRLCLLDPTKQDAVVDRIGDRIAERNADNARRE